MTPTTAGTATAASLLIEAAVAAEVAMVTAPDTWMGLVGLRLTCTAAAAVDTTITAWGAVAEEAAEGLLVACAEVVEVMTAEMAGASVPAGTPGTAVMAAAEVGTMVAAATAGAVVESTCKARLWETEATMGLRHPTEVVEDITTTVWTAEAAAVEEATAAVM